VLQAGLYPATIDDVGGRLLVVFALLALGWQAFSGPAVPSCRRFTLAPASMLVRSYGGRLAYQ
jgi:hypothetical protein